jgi:hypothetical protein
MVHHISVPAEHTPLTVLGLHHSHLVTFPQGRQIASAFLSAPASLLPGTGQCRLNGQGILLFEPDQYLQKILVCTTGHAADIIVYASLTKLSKLAFHLQLECPAPKVCLIGTPGQFFRPVSGKRTCLSHRASPFQAFSISIPQKISNKKVDIHNILLYSVDNRISDEPCFQGRVRGLPHNSRPAVMAYAQSARASFEVLNR